MRVLNISNRITLHIRETLWKNACRYDEVDSRSQFVVFSKSNPFDVDYGKIQKLEKIYMKGWILDALRIPYN